MIDVMSRTTGLSLVSIEEDCVHVMFRQEVPMETSGTGGKCRVCACACVCAYVHTWL